MAHSDESHVARPVAVRLTAKPRAWLAVAVGVTLAVGLAVRAVLRVDPICGDLTCFEQSSAYVATAHGREARYTITTLVPGLLSPRPAGITGAQLWREPVGAHHVQVVASITNISGHGIAVDSVALPTGVSNVREVTTSFYAAGPDGRNAGAPLHRFTLPAHSSKLVVIDYVQGCVPSRNGEPVSGVDAVSVRYSLWGFTHTAYAILGAAYALAAPRRC